MKKLMSILIFTILCLYSFNNVKADNSTDIKKWNYSLISDNVQPWDCRLAQYQNSETGKVGFCIEPDIKFDKSVTNYKKVKSNNYSNEELVKIINAYDYLSNSATTRNEKKNYYIAAQLMIWENVTGVSATIDGNDSYYYGKQELLDYIDNNLSLVEINMDDINDAIYLKEDTIEFNDIDLNNYNIDSVGLDIKIEDNNKISYKVNNVYPLDKSINITPKVDYLQVQNNSTFIYQSDSSQDILSFEDNFPLYLKGASLSLNMKKGNLHLTKKDEFDNLVLDNIIFHIYDSSSNEILKDDGTYFYTQDGYLNIDNILPVGDYYLIEEENDNYIALNEPIEFSIIENETTELEVINSHKNISITFKKIDENNNSIKGAEFKLYDLNGNNEILRFIEVNTDINLLSELPTKVYTDPSIILSERYSQYYDGNIFNSNEIGYFTYEIYDLDELKEEGKVYVINDPNLSNNSYNEINASLVKTLITSDINCFDNLKFNNSYLLCETEPYLGYEYASNPCVIVSTSDPSYRNEITFINRTRNYSLKLIKVSNEKEILLDGAKFEVKYYDSDNIEHIEEFTTGHTNDDIKGGFLIKEIPYNKPVIVKEVEAPKGYIIDNKEYTLYPNIKYSDITFTNNRVNSAIILPGYRIVNTCVEK